MKQKLLVKLLFLLLLGHTALAQNRKVSGKVTDSDGGGVLPGVTVKIQGMPRGTVTGTDGRYLLEAPAGAVLEFIYIGYGKQTRTLGDELVLNIELSSENTSLTEVVVTAFGINKASRTNGYSVAQINGEEINRAAPVSIMGGLQGKVAGVDIATTSGSPGGSSKTVIRGFSSIAGNNQPLYVVDGVPVNNARPGDVSPNNSIGDLKESYDFGNAANDINPNDIESVSILKGAAASSLYGSRASSGVILITTKKGKAGRFKVDLTSAAAFTQVSGVPTLQDKYGQGFAYQAWIAENGSWGARFDGQTREWGSEVDGVRQSKPYLGVKNSFRDAFDTGQEYNNTIAFSGGNDLSTFRFSYGNINSNGILPEASDTYKRNTLSLNGSTNYKGITVSAGLNYIGKNTRAVQTGQANSGVGSSFYEDILQIPVEFPISAFKDYHNKYYDVDGFYSPFTQNPYYSVFENGSAFKSDRFYGNADLKAKLASWLTLQFQQGVDVSNITEKIWNAKNRPTPGSWAGGGNDEGFVRQASVGNVVDGSEKYFEFDSKLNALFDKKFNENFDLTGLLGLNFNARGARVLYASIEDLTVPGFYQIENSANPPTTSQTSNERRMFGAYASATLGYKSFAYLTLNARNDWSSTLPVAQRSYFYPGANLSLIISQLADLSSAKISLFKLRAAYGKTGSDTDPYNIYNTIVRTRVFLGGSAYTNFPFDGVAGYTVSNTLKNDRLRPEISTEAELGTELKFFNNRLGIDVSYYNRVTNDQILPIVASPSSGVNFRVVNFGKVRNRGVEVALTGSLLKTPDFNWDLTYTFTRNRNKVLSLPDGLTNVILNFAYDAQFVAKVGEPLGVFEAPVPLTDPQGRIVVNAANGVPVVAPNLGTYGNSQRDYIMGINNSFRYKNLSLGFTLDYKKGGIFYSGTADLLSFVGNSINTTWNDRRTFVVPNSVIEVVENGVSTYRENNVPITETRVFGYYYTDAGKAVAYKDRLLDKTAFKVREVTLSYSLPKSIAEKLRTDKATLTLYGRNLLTWLPASNSFIDPEVSNYGNDLSSEFGEFRTGPATRNFGLSLNLTF
ncbi:SusC/RagA family TonB-linked outer membrane protein [Pedobacter ginsengisoli]|uniref:SusC/RagA family TonB-linked outer membrane protein n=1 Tax=Pedobacter ginsengisoli TaxID=363852 RepID=UPI0025507B4B|nr:SusC/RagA family TonB-linked outer membrane protein [Pedobacter ginsengisoli]